jgi:hypothetical protein
MAFLSINEFLFVFLQFRYADSTDRVILIFGILFSMALGTCMPLNILVNLKAHDPYPNPL